MGFIVKNISKHKDESIGRIAGRLQDSVQLFIFYTMILKNNFRVIAAMGLFLLSSMGEILANNFSVNNADGVTIYYKTLSGNECEVTGASKYSGTIVIPSSVSFGGSNYTVTAIGDYAFQFNWELPSVILPESLITIGEGAFSFCDLLTSVNLPENLTSIGNYAFENCYSLSSVCMPENLTSIGNYAFENCSSLTSVGLLPESLTYIGQASFSKCSSLSSIDVDSDNPNYMSQDGVLFNKNQTELVCFPAGKASDEYVVPNSVTSIGFSAFAGSSSLTSISLPDNLTSVYYDAFFDCCLLTSISLPEKLTFIGENPFAHCSSLTSITVDSDNPNYASEDGVLFNKDKTELICFPGGKANDDFVFPNNVIAIGYDAFAGCSSLTSIYLPDVVTTIGYRAFEGCSSLTSITLPKNLFYIETYTFYGCSSLSSVTIHAETPPIMYWNAFFDVNLSEATLYVPAGTQSLYAEAGGWRNFGSIVELSVTALNKIGVNIEEVADIYRVDGRKADCDRRNGGLDIIRMKDGSVRKEMIR